MGILRRLFKYHFPDFDSMFYRRWSGASGVVLMYHEVLPDAVDIPAWTVVTEWNFRRQMEYLKANFDVLSLDEALDRVIAPEKCGRRRPFAVVTFDDGYSGNLLHVLPIMRDLALPFAVFIASQAVQNASLFWYDQVILALTTGSRIEETIATSQGELSVSLDPSAGDRNWTSIQKVLTELKKLPPHERQSIAGKLFSRLCREAGRLRMLTCDELKTLSESPLVTIGGHTHDHALLDQVSQADGATSIRLNLDYIEDVTGHRPIHFAYPNGNFNAQATELVRAANYRTAVTTRPGRWTPASNVLAVPRYGVGRFDSVGQFRARLLGWL